MVAVFAVGCGIALLWTGIKYQIIYNSVIDSFPPQFQGDLTSRYAFTVLVLSPSTPLPLQAEYVKASWGGCVAGLSISLCFFSVREPILGCLFLVIFIAAVVSTLRSRKTYKENCNRVLSDEVKEGCDRG
jgi:hypothetical protein